jgi:hypothetical protein
MFGMIAISVAQFGEGYSAMIKTVKKILKGQELIESIVWAHNKLKVAPTIQPRALSITQGRAVGVAHYLLGGIATTWSFFLARIIAVG